MTVERSRRYSDEVVPYAELDAPVVRLCRAINALPGLATIGSCGGHPGPDAFLPEDEWTVVIKLDLVDSAPTSDGWISLEFLGWVIHDFGRAGKRVQLAAGAAPPYLNGPGTVLSFAIDGWRGDAGGVEPDELAKFLERVTEDLFVPAAQLDEFYRDE